MELRTLPYKLTVCKLADLSELDLNKEFYFLEKTDEELSLVCRTEDTPENTTQREDGWNGFRIEGVLEFSLVGVLAKLAGVLGDNGISVFAVSTYNTDYILIKEESIDRAIEVLTETGYTIV